jgi:GNAT superfamily N-acetyltransferase
MDGNTWRQYRLVTDRGHAPPFFLEPDNPHDWPDHFVQNGFEPVAQYFSALNANLRNRAPGLDGVGRRMTVQGVQIRSLERDQFDDQLRRIHAIATIAFRDNLFYSPLAQPEFIAQYRALSRLVPMNLVLIAERQDQPIGFVFAVPDLLQAQRGEPIDTIIVKSLGVLPGRPYAGLGNLLLASVEERARELGYARSVYALVRDLPRLRRMSGRYARPIRRYALFAKVIRR